MDSFIVEANEALSCMTYFDHDFGISDKFTSSCLISLFIRGDAGYISKVAEDHSVKSQHAQDIFPGP